MINAINASKHFREESLDSFNVLTITNDFKQIIISYIIESREVDALVLEIFIQFFLYAR